MTEKILVVDDSELERNILISILNSLETRKNTCILEATNGRDAINIIKEELPDIIFLDCFMPQLNGLETIRKIRFFGQERYTPYVIMVTSEENTLAEALQCGCDDFLTKPVAKEHLAAKLLAGRRILGVYSKLRSQSLIMEQLAMTDPLTGLANRRMMEIQLKQLLEKDGAIRGDTSICMMDIDGFKSINDNYGHIYGDSVLKILGNILKDDIRNSDFVARFGGDEFVLLFPKTTSRDASMVSNRVLQKIKTKIRLPDGIGLELSSGIYTVPSCYDQIPIDVKSILKLADEKLYEEKNKKKLQK